MQMTTFNLLFSLISCVPLGGLALMVVQRIARMSNVFRVAVLAAMEVLAISTPVQAAAERELFTAMVKLVSHFPASEPLRGEWKDGNLVDMWQTGSGVEGHVMSPGGDPCVLVHLWVDQRDGEWAKLSTKTYDFRKLASARFLADADNRETAASRTEDDQEATELLLEGAAWSAHRIVHIDPATPAFDQINEDNWSIVVLNQEDRTAVADAIRIIRQKCFAQH